MTASSQRVVRSSYMARFTGDCSSFAEGVTFTHKAQQGEKPAHWHVRILDPRIGVDVHLRDGLDPPKEGKPFLADVEIKERVVDGHKTYVYLNLYPPTGTEAQYRVQVTRTPLDLSGIGEASRKDKEDFVEHCIDANGTVTVLKNGR